MCYKSALFSCNLLTKQHPFGTLKSCFLWTANRTEVIPQALIISFNCPLLHFGVC